MRVFLLGVHWIALQCILEAINRYLLEGVYVMGSDRESRVLAACETIEIDGKEYKLRPIVAQHLCDLEVEALRHYKRQYLETFSENADLIPNGSALIEKKIEEVARWDLSDLPQKDAYDVSRIPINDQIKKWVTDNNDELPDTDNGIKAIIVNALDTGKLSPKDVRKLSGRTPIQGRVRYDQWWVTASMNGQISFIVSSVKYEHPEVTKKQVAQWPFGKIAEAARKVESITTASMGNI